MSQSRSAHGVAASRPVPSRPRSGSRADGLPWRARRDRAMVSRLWTRAIVFTLVALVAASCGFRSIDSGDGWVLESREAGVGDPPGSVIAEALEGALGVRFVVESGTGGDSECSLPWIEGSERTDDVLTIDIVWEKRGCRDIGPVEFTLRVQDVPEAGLGLAFPISPERPCMEAHFKSDGTTVSCTGTENLEGASASMP